MVNMIRDEREEGVSITWREIEEEMSGLRELQNKTMKNLQICRSQMESQVAMLKIANKEVNTLQEDLSKS